MGSKNNNPQCLDSIKFETNNTPTDNENCTGTTKNKNLAFKKVWKSLSLIFGANRKNSKIQKNNSTLMNNKI